MAVVFAVLVALFVAKLVWNATLPIWLARGRGVSIHLQVELVLLVALLCVATNPTLVAVVGCAAIAASYGIAFGIGMLLGWRYRGPR
jgi:hypothetical protein